MIRILLAGNRGVARGLLINVISYCIHNDEPAEYLFLTMDHSEDDPRFLPLCRAQADYLNHYLQSRNPTSSFRLVDVKPYFDSSFQMSRFAKTHFTPYALLRLVADLVPEVPAKTLYLDTDTLIQGTLSPLFNFDMEDYEFFAARDELGQHWIGKDYQNSGVMLFNMAKVRETGLFGKCRAFLQEHNPTLVDQTPLNYFVRKKAYLDRVWNAQKEGIEGTRIRHFTGQLAWWPFIHERVVKPWDVERVHKVLKTNVYDDVLDRYLAMRDEFLALGEKN